MKCMSEGRSLWRLYDHDPKRFGCVRVENFREADEWNNKHFGIFWTVNEFTGDRKKENCVRILSWAVDIDTGTKLEQKARIKKLNINPSAVIETARGYHVYFDAVDADPANYSKIVMRMIDLYGGDPNAKDITRILRVPAYVHWKDCLNPKSIKMVYSTNSVYSEKEIIKAFPEPKKESLEFQTKRHISDALKSKGISRLGSDVDVLSDRIWSLDCFEALQRISGTEVLCGEKISFQKTSGGKFNIICNEKSTSCWIDADKRIGSSDNGGPTIWQWINWYHHDHKKTYRFIAEYFPEVIQ